jgi:hypothetical protein
MVGWRAVRLEGSTVCLLVVWMGAMTAGVLGDPMVGDLVDVRVSLKAADLVDELVAKKVVCWVETRVYWKGGLKAARWEC